MVKNLIWNSEKISWTFKREIEKEIKNIILADDIKNKQLIHIKAGENYMEDRVFFFHYNGGLALKYDKTQNKIEWNNKGESYCYEAQNLEQAGYYPAQNRILILQNLSSKMTVLGLDLDKNQKFETISPDGYRIQYLSEINRLPVVVCDGDEKHQDQFGRSRVNFYINVDSGILQKGNLAY